MFRLPHHTGLALLLLIAAVPQLTGCLTAMHAIRPRAPFAAVGHGPLIVAHRGGSLEAPENTVASIRHGVAVGSDWQELDVQLTRDGRVVVLHDERLERTTSGHGLAERQSLATMALLTAGAPSWDEAGLSELAALQVAPPSFGSRYAGERVPTLDAVLAVPHSRLMIELKPSPRPSIMASQVIGAIGRARAYDRVAVASFQVETLAATYALDPALPLVGIADQPLALERLLELPLAVLAVRKGMLPLALSLAPPGVAVWVWTAYTPGEAEALWSQGAHGIITDVPAATVAALREPASGHLAQAKAGP